MDAEDARVEHEWRVGSPRHVWRIRDSGAAGGRRGGGGNVDPNEVN